MFQNVLKGVASYYKNIFITGKLISEIAESTAPPVENYLDECAAIIATAAEQIGYKTIELQGELKGTITSDKLKELESISKEIEGWAKSYSGTAETAGNGIVLRFKQVKKNVQDYSVKSNLQSEKKKMTSEPEGSEVN